MPKKSKQPPFSTKTLEKFTRESRRVIDRLHTEEDRRDARLRRAILAVGNVENETIPPRVFKLIQVARMTVFGDWAANVADPSQVERPEDAEGRRAIKMIADFSKIMKEDQ